MSRRDYRGIFQLSTTESGKGWSPSGGTTTSSRPSRDTA
jgi:hypothetical protein